MLSFLFILSLNSGCAVFRKVLFNYSVVKIPSSQVRRDIAYWRGADADPIKHKLDLYLPNKDIKQWPVLVFVHGGEWISGDKALRVMGSDIYGNVGRYFASQGVGVAVINYRLMPQFKWSDEYTDVARALYWVHEHIRELGGDPEDIFLAGHSSGAQLITKIALDPHPLRSLGSSPDIICGVMPISGAGYDLTDPETLELAEKEDLFEKLFNKETISEKTKRQLSPIKWVNRRAPPFLIFYAENEDKELRHGSIKLNERLMKFGIQTQVMEIPSMGHRTIVLGLSNPKKIPAAAMMVFIKNPPCH